MIQKGWFWGTFNLRISTLIIKHQPIRTQQPSRVVTSSPASRGAKPRLDLGVLGSSRCQSLGLKGSMARVVPNAYWWLNSWFSGWLINWLIVIIRVNHDHYQVGPSKVVPTFAPSFTSRKPAVTWKYTVFWTNPLIAGGWASEIQNHFLIFCWFQWLKWHKSSRMNRGGLLVCWLVGQT